jgi:hypothetical protein
MKTKFDCRDMVFFLEEGADFVTSIHHGIITQVDYAVTERSMGSYSVSKYHVAAIDCNGELKHYSLVSGNVYESVDDILNSLKRSHEPEVNYEALRTLVEKSEHLFLNRGYTEDLEDGYLKEYEELHLV